MLDCIIVGAGPAGMTSAIYAVRAGLSALVLEKVAVGGQMALSYEVENYPGFEKIGGVELSNRMREHATALGAEIKSGNVESISFEDGIWRIDAGKKQYESRTVIAATGGYRRKLDVPGEEEFTGVGVSYCATCDGNFFRGKEVAVVGGGNTAFEDAIYLSGLCERVYLIHRRDGFRAEKRLVNQLTDKENIVKLINTVVKRVKGDQTVSALELENVQNGEQMELQIAGVFAAVGIVPETGWLKDILTLDEGGYVASGEDCKTELPGLFVAGDLRRKPIYQIVTAAADGAVAATAAIQYVQQYV